MRFGVVCEGATDFITIANFLTRSLSALSLDAEFIDLQPGMDKTSERNCGWANALLWLKKNSLQQRKISFLGSGLFSGRLGSKKCDAIVVVLDADCVQDDGFHNFCEKNGFPTLPDASPNDVILHAIAQFSEIEIVRAGEERHIFCSSVHNSESWCVGVIHEDPPRKVEDISSEEANLILLSALSGLSEAAYVSEGRRLKDRRLREAFCKANIDKVPMLENRSLSYKKLVFDAGSIFF